MQLARKYQVMAEIFTNGTCVDMELIRQYQDNIRTIFFSFDSPWKETYESIRRGARFDDVVENMKALQKFRGHGKRAMRPFFVINMVLMKRNYRQLADMVRFARRIGADGLSVSKIDISNKKIESESLEGTGRSLQKIVREAKNVACEQKIRLIIKNERGLLPGMRGRNRSLHGRKGQGGAICPFLWQRVILDMDSNVVVCCGSMKKRIAGNMKKNSFREIWNSSIYRSLRCRSWGQEQDDDCRICRKKGYCSPLFSEPPLFSGYA